MESRFRKVYREARFFLGDPKNTQFVVHTSVGAITVRVFRYEEEFSYVFIAGTDEIGNERILGFSEEMMATFAFEVRPVTAQKDEPVGFAARQSDDVS
jgi:hypothetical protein